MNNIILCESCGCSGRAVNAAPVNDSGYPLFYHLGHDVSTGHMHYRCARCGALLLVDPMQMITSQFVRGIVAGFDSAFNIAQREKHHFSKQTYKSMHS